MATKKKTAEEWRRLAEERIGDDDVGYLVHRSRGYQVWDDLEELHPQLTALARQDGWLPPKRKPNTPDKRMFPNAWDKLLISRLPQWLDEALDPQNNPAADPEAEMLDCPRYHSVFQISHWDAQAGIYRLSLQNAQLTMSRDTFTNGGSETPLDFFRSLAAARTSWSEPLTWESFTREQAFTATCDDTGHVELVITLRETSRLWEKTRWEASITQYWELGDLAESVQPLVWYLEARVLPDNGDSPQALLELARQSRQD
jgi:hypothetical protein